MLRDTLTSLAQLGASRRQHSNTLMLRDTLTSLAQLGASRRAHIHPRPPPKASDAQRARAEEITPPGPDGMGRWHPIILGCPTDAHNQHAAGLALHPQQHALCAHPP
eukprot:361562-Chlamydomonas_euryale.AAC.4